MIGKYFEAMGNLTFRYSLCKTNEKKKSEMLRKMETTGLQISLKTFIHLKWNVYCILYYICIHIHISFKIKVSFDFVFRFVETLFWLHIKWWPCIVHHTLNVEFKKMISIFSVFVSSKWITILHRFFICFSFCVASCEVWVKSRYITFRTYSAILSAGSVNFFSFFSFYFVLITFCSAFCTSVSNRLIWFRLFLTECIWFDSF